MYYNRLKSVLAAVFAGVCLLPAEAQERVELCILQGSEMPDIVKNSQLELETVRINQYNGTERGVLGETINFAANMATRAITSIIDNARSKRTVEWTAPVTKDNFYSSVSYLGPLDPSGLQFSGFTMKRAVADVSGTDEDSTAMYLKCSLPTEYMSNFIANSRFTLQVDTLAIDLSKVRAKYTAKKTISIEITIKMISTWMDSSLAIHKDQQLGEFKICLDNLKYDPDSTDINLGGEAAKDLITGFSFFVPRSYGAYTVSESYCDCWGQGEFSILVSVKESTARRPSASKNSEYMWEYFQSAFPRAVTDIVSNKEIIGSKVVEIINTY